MQAVGHVLSSLWVELETEEAKRLEAKSNFMGFLLKSSFYKWINADFLFPSQNVVCLMIKINKNLILPKTNCVHF